MKVLLWLSVVLVFGGVMAGVAKKEKKKSEEDIYGDLSENDENIQKDQVEYDYPEKDYEGAPEEPSVNIPNVDVRIISKPQTFQQKMGTVVVLPCQSNYTDVVRVWTKDSALIVQGSLILNDNPNYHLFSNGSLRVILATESDFGKYQCKLVVTETEQPSIMHEVLQLLSPTITKLSADKTHIPYLYNLGESLTLTCKATGKPHPKIIWHKNNEHLGTEGETLTIQNVKAKHSGNYMCLADNNVGDPVHRYIEILVNHPPIISVEKYIVNSDHGRDAELVCEVKAYPRPNVQWLKNGAPIVPDYPKVDLKFENNNEKNIIILRNITDDDFTQYSCVANNELGKQIRNITLVKFPVIRYFENKQDKVQWRAESKQKVTEHQLQYRRKGESEWSVISPNVAEATNDVYLIKHMLTNLPAGEYETRARSKNAHGWSDFTDTIPFQKAPDPTLDTPAQHRSEEGAVEATTSGSSVVLGSSLLLILLSLLNN